VNRDKWNLTRAGWVPVPQKGDQFKIHAVTWHIDLWKKLLAEEVWMKVYWGGENAAKEGD